MLINIWFSVRNKLSRHDSLTAKGLADPLSSLPDMTLAFFLVSLNLSIAGGFTSTTKGLNSAVRRCFIVWTEGKENKHERESKGRVWGDTIEQQEARTAVKLECKSNFINIYQAQCVECSGLKTRASLSTCQASRDVYQYHCIHLSCHHANIC